MTSQSFDSNRRASRRTGRNRRFVISIWFNTAPDGGPLVDSLYGHIWEADATAPGKLADPVEFDRLSAVETALDGFLRSDASPDPSDESGGI